MKYGWKECKLGEIIELIGGGTPKTSISEYWNGEIPWLSVVDFNFGNKYVYKTEKTITTEGLKNSSTKLLNPGDIIISARGTVGALAVLKKQMAFNQSCYGIRGIQSISHQDYLYYLIKDSINNLQQIAHGGVFDTITRDTFDEIIVNLPSISEQRAIARILSDLDEKIEINRQMNKTLESIAQAIFKQWFVDFEPWGGKQPDDWQNYILGDISTLSAGGDRPEVCSEKPSATCTIPIYSNGIDNDGLYGYTDSAKIIDESVTVSARGTIGFTCLRQVPYFPIVRLISLVPNPKYLSAKYLYLWLKNINISGTGTTQQQLTVPDFKKTEIFIPTPEIMKQFTIIADALFAQITANKDENTTITAIRDSLLPRLISGKIRIKI